MHPLLIEPSSVIDKHMQTTRARMDRRSRDMYQSPGGKSSPARGNHHHIVSACVTTLSFFGCPRVLSAIPDDPHPFIRRGTEFVTDRRVQPRRKIRTRRNTKFGTSFNSAESPIVTATTCYGDLVPCCWWNLWWAFTGELLCWGHSVAHHQGSSSSME